MLQAHPASAHHLHQQASYKDKWTKNFHQAIVCKNLYFRKARLKLYTRERDLVLNSCLKLLTPSEERESEGGSAFQKEVYMEKVEFQCKYWTCNFRCVSKADMTDHISKKHVIDEVFVCFKSTEEAKCPD